MDFAPPAPPPSDVGNSLEQDQVMSEVHLGCPPNYTGPYISRFTISLPSQKEDEGIEKNTYELDEDGDLIVTRRKKPDKDSFVISIQHSITSSIPKVGLQIWRAELLLADFLLHKIFTSSEFHEVIAAELGAGTGLVGMLLARVAKTVFITDHGDEVLENCEKNIHLNSGIFHPKASVYVRELDWNAPWPPQEIQDSSSSLKYGWTVSEVEQLHRCTLLVAADVIYSDELTDAFFRTTKRLMSQSPDKVLYLALEKRYNFSLDDLDIVANGYSKFLSYLLNENGNEVSSSFSGERVNLAEIPQYVWKYERGEDVELWKIKYNYSESPSPRSLFGKVAGSNGAIINPRQDLSEWSTKHKLLVSNRYQIRGSFNSHEEEEPLRSHFEAVSES